MSGSSPSAPWYKGPEFKIALASGLIIAIVSGLITLLVGGGSDGKGSTTIAAVSPSTSQTSSATAPAPSPTDSPSPSFSSTSATPDPPSSTPSPVAVSLAQLTPVTGNIVTDPVSLGGTQYVDLVRQDPERCGKQEADFDLGKKYSYFTAKAGLSDEYNTMYGPWVFALYSVGSNGNQTLFKKIVKFGDVDTVRVSVKGVLRLRLSIEWIDPGTLQTCSGLEDNSAVWANASLIP